MKTREWIKPVKITLDDEHINLWKDVEIFRRQFDRLPVKLNEGLCSNCGVPSCTLKINKLKTKGYCRKCYVANKEILEESDA